VALRKIGVFRQQVGAWRGFATSFELVLIKLGGWCLLPVGDGESRELELPSGWSL
jgi:hypothetical protein